MKQEFRKNGYVISTDKSKLDLNMIHTFLSSSYWAKDIPFDKMKKCVEHALCYGVYHHEQQIGFARVITDFARIAHLADVFILPSHRGKGLGKWLMECVVRHPDLQGCKWLLATRDAHKLYEQFGFQKLKNPDSFMEKLSRP